MHDADPAPHALTKPESIPSNALKKFEPTTTLNRGFCHGEYPHYANHLHRQVIYTDKSITSTLRVTNSKSNTHVDGYVLENIRAGSTHEKLPTSAGIYMAKERADGRLGWRLELLNVPGHSHIEIHAGNYPFNSHGCFLPGLTSTKDAVGHSREVLNEIKSMIDKDGSKSITVQVIGSNANP